MPAATSYVLNKFLPAHLSIWLLAAGLLVLTACSGNPTTAVFAPAEVAADRSGVYVYRPARMDNAMYSPELYINDAFSLKIGNGRQVYFSLPAGETVFEIKSEYATAGGGRLRLDLRPGQIRYIRVDTALTLSTNPAYEPYQRSFSLLAIAPEQAAGEIALCCSYENKSAKTGSGPPETGPVPEQQGFSTDKTQNPFSH